MVCGVDWGNQIAAGLIECYTPTTSGLNSAGVSKAVSSFGVGLKASSASASGLVMSPTAKRTSGAGTVVFIAPAMSSFATYEYFWDGETASNRDLFYHIPPSGRFGWYVNSTLIADDPYNIIEAGFLGRVNALRWKNGAQSAWKDGVLFQSWTRALSATTARNVRLTTRNDSTESLTSSSIILRAEWNRELSDAEIVALADDPWQIFAPRSILIPTASAAAGLPTLSAPTYVPGSITISGFTGRVTAA